MFKHVIAPVIALAATVGIFAIPQTALAETVGTSISVTYADLDLTTPAGRRTLDRRIERAARQICDVDNYTTGSRIRSSDAANCYAQALRDVRTRVATAVNTSRSGG